MSELTLDRDLERIIIGYVDAACWADLDQSEREGAVEGELGAEAYEYRVADLDDESLANVTEVCENFLNGNRELCEAYALEYASPQGEDVWECLGHDLWLTQRGHGVGFWDRGLGELGDKLTEACKADRRDDVPWLDAEGIVHFDKY